MGAPGTPLAVVGAGPAGLAAALAIRRAGRSVVVHERNRDVGTRFHGDFQGLENWTTEGDVLDELSALGIEPDFPATPFREVVCFGPDGRAYQFRARRPLFYLVRRGVAEDTLDQALKRQAQARGVEIRFGSSVDQLPEGGVVTGGPRRGDVIASGYLFDTELPNGAYAVVSEQLAPGGYAYLLVSGGRATLATCLFADFHREREYLGRTVAFFRQKTGVRVRDAVRFGGVGNVWLARSARRGGLLYAGEMAGFQDALFGFGMRCALISGAIAGGSLLSDLNQYDRLWQRRLRGFMQAGAVNRAIYRRLGDRGYSFVLNRYPVDLDVRGWMRRAYAPVWWKRLLYPLTRVRRPLQAEPHAACDCTWCRCSRHGGAYPAEDAV